jgi:nucleoside-diphosphate-sugar epimerase
MRLLILGGTAFLGRAVARAALAGGYDVICAARGVSGNPVPGSTLIPVDRERPDGLAALDRVDFDAVLDVSSVPSQVRRAVAALGDRAGHWTYVSTGSVYADHTTPGQRVDRAPVLAAAPPEVDDPRGNDRVNYGPCKVACEEAVREKLGDRAFICRAGLIVGPEDDSDRFTYWPVRLDRGGPVLAPGRPDEPVQLVDVRDLAEWLVRSAAAGLTGTLDGMAPAMPRGEFLAEVSAGVGRPGPELVWLDQDFLLSHEVGYYSGAGALPLWLPLPEYGGHASRDVTPTLRAGLTTRPLAGTARDTLEWYASSGRGPLSCGLAAEDETKLLDAWRPTH